MTTPLSKNQRRIQVVVTLTPAQLKCENIEIACFVEEALSTMGGCKHPDDPFFDSLVVDHITMNNRTYSFEENDHAND